MDVSAVLRRADLNLIPALAALLEHRNVTRAADTMRVGQPAMSTALARLRRLFDDPLLVRRGRILELTPMGQALVEPVHEVLASLEQLLAITPSFDPTTDRHAFTIAASDYVTLVLLRPLLDELHRDAPGVGVQVVPVNRTTAAAVERARVDLALVPRQIMASRTPGIESRELFTERYVPVVWSQNREVGDILDRDSMQRIGYVRYLDEDSGTPSFIDAQLSAMGIQPQVALTALSFALVPLLLLGTQFFGFVQERLVRMPHVRPDLRVLTTSISPEPIVQCMYWNPVMQRDPAHRWLRERIATIAADL
ncbi:LysR family transcriptional regulator [Pseudonocardia xinjiangensis]|uniref:LysR family transcriptional regulator n=1 Tax=Pseudonocardia xinjiangensis TaxID=75289 RepID=UPI003D9504FB